MGQYMENKSKSGHGGQEVDRKWTAPSELNVPYYRIGEISNTEFVITHE